MSGARMLATAVRRAGRESTRGQGAPRVLAGGCKLRSPPPPPPYSLSASGDGHSRIRSTPTGTQHPAMARRRPYPSLDRRVTPSDTHDPADLTTVTSMARRAPAAADIDTRRWGRAPGAAPQGDAAAGAFGGGLHGDGPQGPTAGDDHVELRVAEHGARAAGDDDGGLFNIHVLAEGAEGARVAEWFTRGNAAGEGLFRELPDGVEVCEEDGAAPVLEGKGVLYVLQCKALGEGMVRVRDHVVVVGEVEGVLRGEGEGFGLVYADRRYRVLGDVLVKEEE
ncbi:putative flavin reductase like domain-containing protein [Colletotrichum sublineola]|uniref:Putative flavin reductase like domain-containing protein n=1 Tax=Colletotrichum sublineola TaxID=1173701 RepID=A0A066XVL2_COLSU|nr:putative flavin reductase like domain-containing protein [Colletotrichum sublineola]